MTLPLQAGVQAVAKVVHVSTLIGERPVNIRALVTVDDMALQVRRGHVRACENLRCFGEAHT